MASGDADAMSQLNSDETKYAGNKGHRQATTAHARRAKNPKVPTVQSRTKCDAFKDAPTRASQPEKQPGSAADPPARIEAIRKLAQLANQGNKQALADLRQLLDDCPEVWAAAGDLTAVAERLWIDRVVGQDHLA